MKQPIKLKKRGFELETKTFTGSSGVTYIVHRAPKGSVHVFVEVEAEAAAEDCGASKDGGPRKKWKSVWNSQKVDR